MAEFITGFFTLLCIVIFLITVLYSVGRLSFRVTGGRDNTFFDHLIAGLIITMFILSCSLFIYIMSVGLGQAILQ